MPVPSCTCRSDRSPRRVTQQIAHCGELLPVVTGVVVLFRTFGAIGPRLDVFPTIW